MGNDENSTVLITNIYDALNAANSEAAKRPACLLVVGGELNGTIIDLRPGKTTVGRSANNTVILEFPGISKSHFEIETQEEENTSKSVVADLGSTNGTYVNDIKINGKVILRRNDIIKIGTFAFKYLPKGDPERLTYDKLHLEANTDGLTKCYNKMFFNHALDLEVKKSKTTGLPLNLIIFDLDHFKKLNDNFGHDAGDYVLKEMAALIRKNGIREGDVFARYGGEEFVILLPRTNITQAYEIAERLRRAIEQHTFDYHGKKLPVRASVGVADYRPGVNTGVDLFRRADQAVYQSKEAGRNKVTLYKEK